MWISVVFILAVLAAALILALLARNQSGRQNFLGARSSGPVNIFNTSGTILSVGKDSFILGSDLGNVTCRISPETVFNFPQGQLSGKQGLRKLYKGFFVAVESPDNIKGKSAFLVSYVTPIRNSRGEALGYMKPDVYLNIYGIVESISSSSIELSADGRSFSDGKPRTVKVDISANTEIVSAGKKVFGPDGIRLLQKGGNVVVSSLNNIKDKTEFPAHIIKMLR